MREAKIALVTGGERGIGAGICERLLGEGWRLLVAGLDEESWERFCSLDSFADGDCLFLKTDVASEGQVQASVQEVLRRFGRLDGLILNAGIASPERLPVEELSLEAWQRVIEVNLTSAFLYAKYASPELRKTKGAMVTIASTRADMSEANTFAYSASKGGLVALTHSLACSLGPEIRVNAISPGWIHTGTAEELSAEDHKQHPCGRVGRPSDIAAMVSYLLGEGAGFVTGQNFVVDGGMTKKMIYCE